MMKVYTVDRFENDHAVLLNRDNEVEQVVVSKKQLPSEVREGDLLKISFRGNGQGIEKAELMKHETELIKKKTEDLLQKLLDKNK